MFLGLRRQRRRIVVTMALVLWALVFGIIGQAGLLMRLQELFGGPSILALAYACGTILALSFIALILILRFAPWIRRQCEVVALTVCVFEAVNAVLIWSGAPFASPLLAVCFFVILALLIDRAAYGPMLDWMGLWRRVAAGYRFPVRATPHACWNAILPRPDTVATHWIGALTDVTPTRERDVFIARYRLGDGTLLVKTLTVLDDHHPTHMRYHFEPEIEEDEDGRFGAGFYEVFLDPLDDELTDVTITCEYTSLRLRTALTLWFDDWLGAECDAIQAFVEGRPDRSIHNKLWGDLLRQA